MYAPNILRYVDPAGPAEIADPSQVIEQFLGRIFGIGPIIENAL